MKHLILIFFSVKVIIHNVHAVADPFQVVNLPANDSLPSLPTRRILHGHPARDTRPFMVYLRAAIDAEPKIIQTNWLCGGVIIHERYVLTSAACIEDVKRFYVVSGTDKWISVLDDSNECVKNGAKRAVWKCVPRSYFFDGDEFDNIRWMVGDIAIVKVESEFNFERRIRGCDYIPMKIDYNNESLELEKAGTLGTVIGWGATDQFTDADKVPLRTALNSYHLLESDVVIISKKSCRDRWEERYHFIINEHMLCSKDVTHHEDMNLECTANEMKCKDLVSSDEWEYYTEDENEEQEDTRRMMDPRDMVVHTAAHRSPTRRNRQKLHRSGGFCENDHGGPLVVGHGRSAKIVGIMSACLTDRLTHKCHGPFLFTSVYKYKNLITCAIERSITARCRKLLGTAQNQVVESTLEWPRQSKRVKVNKHTKNKQGHESARSPYHYPPNLPQVVAEPRKPSEYKTPDRNIPSHLPSHLQKLEEKLNKKNSISRDKLQSYPHGPYQGESRPNFGPSGPNFGHSGPNYGPPGPYKGLRSGDKDMSKPYQAPPGPKLDMPGSYYENLSGLPNDRTYSSNEMPLLPKNQPLQQNPSYLPQELEKTGQPLFTSNILRSSNTTDDSGAIKDIIMRKFFNRRYMKI
ncbi:uncharacterized protein LOC142983701 isoform X2 [Anticarsia gemmatalis]|uniref:uncharacterized protein LOC142983701 isoform X2 n=1 Tax=Anticarsia gemmatalis TaxID=129554 RepID=UPI003F76BFB9